MKGAKLTKNESKLYSIIKLAITPLSKLRSRNITKVVKQKRLSEKEMAKAIKSLKAKKILYKRKKR